MSPRHADTMQSPSMAPAWFSSPPQAYSNPITAYTGAVRSPLSRTEPRSEHTSFGFGSHSSPLAARSSTMSFTGNQPQSAERTVRPAWSQRAIKRAPVATGDILKEKRRKMFLNKVKDSRDDGRFEKMGEDIQRLEFVREQKRWEAEQAQSAPVQTMGESDEDLMGWEVDNQASRPSLDLPMYTNAGPDFHIPTSSPEAEAEMIAMREQEELDALLDFLPEQNTHHSTENPDHPSGGDEMMSEHFGSDDEGFDEMFDDFVLDDLAPSFSQAFGDAAARSEGNFASGFGSMDMS
ncbi:hypothetical protein B0A48_14949 [Cryoendolithus antarcticus]|uniref:Uncharacterized protein n=1 Tax=Cryoendolithus antarcticus TaxID=1507870 RepID=A0A1V8SIY0_9PEZI|nr:hypothetical protein B0A48_14949 [Cryoendolithus antarcticus]